MSEQCDIGSHLLAIGHMLGSVDALEAWLTAIKAEVEEVSADDDGEQGGDLHATGVGGHQSLCYVKPTTHSPALSYFWHIAMVFPRGGDKDSTNTETPSPIAGSTRHQGPSGAAPAH